MDIFKTKSSKQKAEPTIALINIVFLMLIFFLVTAQVSTPLDSELKLVKTHDLEQTPPPNHLVISEDGSPKYQGEDIALDRFLAQLNSDQIEVLRIIPDRDTSAVKLIHIANSIRRFGVKEIYLVTERSLRNETQ